MTNLSKSIGLALVVLSGCAYYVRPGEIQPAAAVVSPEQRVATWNRALTVLLAAGWVPQVLDEKACFIGARRRDDDDFENLAGAYISVQIDPAGQLRLQIAGRGTFRSQEALETTVRSFQDQLLAGIVGAGAAPVRPPRS
jgi:hypothetical protein